jgi:hypothetical protein
MLKVVFLNEHENVIFVKEYEEYDKSNVDELYNLIIEEFGCDNSKPYKEIQNEVYGYIKRFNRYGRFEIIK